MKYLARIFGRKVEGIDFSNNKKYTATYYYWRDNVYFWKFTVKECE